MPVSVGVGVFGIGIVVLAHVATAQWETYLPWVCAMLVIFATRLLLAGPALRAVASGSDETPMVNREALLCALTGLGWGSTVYVFDSLAMDQNFYIRLMILATAMSFVLSSMTVFVRVFVAFVGSISVVSLVFLVTASYVNPRVPLVVCWLTYFSLLVGVAVFNNRSIRAAATDRLSVSRLTGELNHAQALGNVGSWVYDIAADNLRLSAEACRIFGLSEDSSTDREGYLALTHPLDRGAVERAWAEATKGADFDYEHRILVGDRVRWIRQKAEFQYALNGSVLNALGIVQDITKRKMTEYQLHELAFSDTLTKLPNRRLTIDRLRQAMAGGKRAGKYGALMILDLDEFKPLNDTHGHQFGDLLLIEAAIRIVGCLRKIDTVGRFGGDEFVVMLSELDVDRAEATILASRVAEKIRLAISQSYVLNTGEDAGSRTTVEHRCTASIGVALFMGDDASADDILKWADAAMYQAKTAGGNAFRFYEAPDAR
jgi:diguanylate cyclase (GGDEF)-like protein/PAS domain S-box-containing protein